MNRPNRVFRVKDQVNRMDTFICARPSSSLEGHLATAYAQSCASVQSVRRVRSVSLPNGNDHDPYLSRARIVSSASTPVLGVPDRQLQELKQRSYCVPTQHSKDVCAICLDMLLGKTTSPIACDHLFHTSCIVEWLKRHNSCPSCRQRAV